MNEISNEMETINFTVVMVIHMAGDIGVAEYAYLSRTPDISTITVRHQCMSFLVIHKEGKKYFV